MPFPLVPKFNLPTGGAGTDYSLTLPQQEWDRNPEVTGGYREAAVRTVRAARTISRVYVLDLVLRVYESEITSIETMVAWMQDNINTPFTYWPDKLDAGVSFAALLVSPVPGNGNLRFERSDFPGARDVPLSLIRSTGASWNLQYYGDT